MPDLEDGAVVHVQGSARDPYELKNVGGVYSCSCPAWRNAGGPIDRRTCKHLRAYRGDAAETARLGSEAGGAPTRQARPESEGAAEGPPVLLAHKWEPHHDVTGWWMSEKLDGVRAYWDGRRFVSRLGNTFFAPSWFTKGLPERALDGELWVGRKQFQTTVSIVRRQDAGEHWRQLRFLVFDAPHLDVPFEERVAWLHGLVGGGEAPFAVSVPNVRCEDAHHLKRELERVEALGGEGLMLRQPGSRYEVGRSGTLLKVKTFHDAEGRVVAHEPGKGKHKGRVGALVVEMPDGTRFNVGTGLSDDERRDPPPLGAIVTYRYQELSRDGVPRFPSFVGLAIDKPGPTAPSSPPPTPRLVTPPPPVTPPPVASPSPEGRRRFEFVEGSSSKFWEVWVAGSEVRTRYGKIGAAGQVTVKDEGSPEKARTLHDKLVREKTGKGYVELVGDPGRVTEDLSALIARVRSKAAAAGVVLAPGASEATLARTEARIGQRLPDDVRAFYAQHDGSSGAYVVEGRELLSMAGIADEWDVWSELLDGGEFGDNDHGEPDEGVRERWWIPEWVPVTYDGSGNHHVVDLAPGKGGVVGQLLSFWHDDPRRAVVGRSFLVWLAETARFGAAGQD